MAVEVPNAASSPHTLSRQDVARILGVSTSSVRRLEWDQLHPVQDQRGIWRFDPQEVEAVAPRPKNKRSVAVARGRDAIFARKRHSGRIAARVFMMFGRGASLRQIVVNTRQPPDVIRQLYREWMTSLDEGEWQRERDLHG